MLSNKSLQGIWKNIIYLVFSQLNDDNMEFEKEKTELIDELKKKIVGDENEGSTIDFTSFIFLFMTMLF